MGVILKESFPPIRKDRLLIWTSLNGVDVWRGDQWGSEGRGMGWGDGWAVNRGGMDRG